VCSSAKYCGISYNNWKRIGITLGWFFFLDSPFYSEDFVWWHIPSRNVVNFLCFLGYQMDWPKRMTNTKYEREKKVAWEKQMSCFATLAGMKIMLYNLNYHNLKF
jgi:hypothetical protein